MAGFLAMLPGLFSSALSSGAVSGLVSKGSQLIGDVLKDVAEGHVNSGRDFGRSLAGNISKLLGSGTTVGPSVSDAVFAKEALPSSEMAYRSTNAADHLPSLGASPQDVVNARFMPSVKPISTAGPIPAATEQISRPIRKKLKRKKAKKARKA